MNPQEALSFTISESAKTGHFDRDALVSQACDLTRELRDHGATPEGTVISVKAVLAGGVVDPPKKMKDDIVTNCIEAFFDN